MSLRPPFNNQSALCTAYEAKMLGARPCCALPPTGQHSTGPSQVLVSRPRTACTTTARCRVLNVINKTVDNNAEEAAAAATISRPMQLNQQLADSAAADTAADSVTLQPDWQLTTNVRLAVIRAAQHLHHTNFAHYLHLLQTKQWQQLTDMVVYSVPGLSQTISIGGVAHHEPATVVLQVPVPANTAATDRQPVSLKTSAAPAADTGPQSAAAGAAADEQCNQVQQQQQQPSVKTLQVMLVGTSDYSDSRCYSIAAKLAELMWADGSSSTPIEAIHLQSWLATLLVCLVNGEQVPPATAPKDALKESIVLEASLEAWRRWQLQEEAAVAAAVKASESPNLQLSIPMKGLAGLQGAEALAAAQSSIRAAAAAVRAAAELAAELQVSEGANSSSSSSGAGGGGSTSSSSGATTGSVSVSSSTDHSRRRRRTKKSSK